MTSRTARSDTPTPADRLLIRQFSDEPSGALVKSLYSERSRAASQPIKFESFLTLGYHEICAIRPNRHREWPRRLLRCHSRRAIRAQNRVDREATQTRR